MVLEKILSIIAEQFQLDTEDISEDTTFEELGADDMDIADIVLQTEDAFDMEISTDEANALRTVSDLADLAESAVNTGE